MNSKLILVSGVLALAALLAGIAGCQSPAETPKAPPASSAASPAPATSAAPAPSPKPTSAAPAVSKPQGTLVVAVSDLQEENWLNDRGAATQALVSSVYDYLYYRDANGKPVPGVAQSWDIAPDGLTYTFHLRKGIQFQDGYGELTADDVKYSYELASRTGSTNAMPPIWKNVVDKVEVVDPYTIVFHTKVFTLMLLDRMGREFSPSLSIVSKKYVDKVGPEQAARKPIGSGPFKFVEHAVGDHMTLEAVENHWRQTPQFKTVVIRKIPEQASRVNMLRAGEADIIEISLDFKNEVQKAGFKTVSSAGAASYSVALAGQWQTKAGFDPKAPWVGDPADPQSMERALKVRKALNLAINRDEIVKSILAGEAESLSVMLASSQTPMYDPALKPYPYDPDTAKKLLAEAGYASGFDITIKLYAMAGRAEGPTIGEAVGMMWQKIGVKTKLEPIDYNAFRPTMMSRKTAPVAWVAGFTIYEEPVTGYQNNSHSKSSLLLSGVETPALDAMIDRAATEPNPQKRADLQRQMAKYVYDNYLMAPIAAKNILWGVSNRVGEWGIAKGQAYVTNLESITRGPGFKP